MSAMMIASNPQETLHRISASMLSATTTTGITGITATVTTTSNNYQQHNPFTSSARAAARATLVLPPVVTPRDDKNVIQLSEKLFAHVCPPPPTATVTTATVTTVAGPVATQVSSDDSDTSDSSPNPSVPSTSSSSKIGSTKQQQQPSTSTTSTTTPRRISSTGMRLNKFVRRLHDMLQSEQHGGIVEWRRGLLVLHSTDAFAKTILPKYFNTRNFKTFRRQLNYYGFVHVRSFSTTGSTTTALWVNRDLAQTGTDQIASVLQLKRVEPCESAKTAEGRRVRKELAVSTVEDDIGVSAKSLQLEQIRSMATSSVHHCDADNRQQQMHQVAPQHHQQHQIPLYVHCHATPPQATPLGALKAPPSLELYQQQSPPMTTTTTTMRDNESAANLLLMLSQSSAPFATTTMTVQ